MRKLVFLLVLFVAVLFPWCLKAQEVVMEYQITGFPLAKGYSFVNQEFLESHPTLREMADTVCLDNSLFLYIEGWADSTLFRELKHHERYNLATAGSRYTGLSKLFIDFLGVPSYKVLPGKLHESIFKGPEYRKVVIRLVKISWVTKEDLDDAIKRLQKSFDSALAAVPPCTTVTNNIVNEYFLSKCKFGVSAAFAPILSHGAIVEVGPYIEYDNKIRFSAGLGLSLDREDQEFGNEKFKTRNRLTDFHVTFLFPQDTSWSFNLSFGVLQYQDNIEKLDQYWERRRAMEVGAEFEKDRVFAGVFLSYGFNDKVGQSNVKWGPELRMQFGYKIFSFGGEK